MDKTAISCPYCYANIGPLSGEDGTEVTIVCSDCYGHYSVDLKSQKVSKKRSGKRTKKSDEDEKPEIKLKCPCGCGSYILNLHPVDTIITTRCSESKQFIGANLLTGRTWLLKKNKPRN